MTRLVAVLLFFAIAIVPVPAKADTAGAQAIERGKAALALYEKGQWAEALVEFRAADALYPSPVFALYAARCLAKLDRLIEAKVTFRALSDRQIDSSAPEPWREAQRAGRAELVVLEAEIPSVIVTVKGGSSTATLRVDDRSEGIGKRIELDPGRHRFVVRDRGREQRESLVLERNARRNLVIELPYVEPDRRPPETSQPSVPGLIMVSVGGTALIAGVVVGVLALRAGSATTEDLPDSCVDRTCPSSRRSEIEEDADGARSLANISTGLVIGGAIVTAAGVVTLLVDKKSARTTGRPGSFGFRF